MRKRLIIKDWEPVIPLLPRGVDIVFSMEDKAWTPFRRDWVAQYYPDAENWRLAAKLNTSEGSIMQIARAMRLKKSHNFLMWEKRDPSKRGKGCPVGFHIETDEEFELRMKQEHDADIRIATKLANRYDFCTKQEKEGLVAVLVEAIEWGRDSQPDLKYSVDYWE